MLAEQIKAELTQRGRDVESSKYLLNWVMNRFRQGDNPVRIYCGVSSFTGISEMEKWLPVFELPELKPNMLWRLSFKYEDGRHYAKLEYFTKRVSGLMGPDFNNSKLADTGWIDVTDQSLMQCFAVDPKDISDKKMFLENEGFKVCKHFEYGKGDVLDITF